jgi:hypothetical protein
MGRLVSPDLNGNIHNRPYRLLSRTARALSGLYSSSSRDQVDKFLKDFKRHKANFNEGLEVQQFLKSKPNHLLLCIRFSFELALQG